MTLAYRKENALNAICPYFTMFPLEYPYQVLKKHRKDTPVILDPFCGRGTSLFAARTLGLSAWGIDTSPVAIAIAKSKLASCNVEEPLALAHKLISEVTPAQIPETSFFENAYHKETLRSLCALREGLLNLKFETDAAVVLRAAALGCLHGPLSKHKENAGYFSNQMPRTYASKPNYAVRFWETRNLEAPKINILEVLRRKISRLAGLEKNSPCPISQVLQGDAQSSEVFQSINLAPSVIITSPPYYGMKTYVQDQWLRNWFLDGPESIDYSTGPQLDHGGQHAFVSSLGKVWKNIADCATSSETLHMYIRFGIIPSASVDAKRIFNSSLEESGISWRLVSTRTAKTADAGKRQAGQMKTTSTAAVEFDFHVERI
ncbi:site-specific DNA-methyltransferase [Salmonella enterica subsp. enterica]|nr:site-specific DNA-methyltransferase [Salmonella enterica subsp. enterica]HEC7100777.1 site-specific DNA-methyltransferase [Salmonella enterica subsp. enterica serovar Mississippi]ECW0062495.1 site-specific DNA-methyltransferase [Salmonella enterica subsp. enterica]ECW0782304.1 site-specific DNA-methyltransferase [Salmonella enterica subsp. enterica]HED0175860.1 site-specific DNA-methyltransferase [Salmonella enterica subsp. enterica serovar Mississippi]